MFWLHFPQEADSHHPSILPPKATPRLHKSSRTTSHSVASSSARVTQKSDQAVLHGELHPATPHTVYNNCSPPVDVLQIITYQMLAADQRLHLDSGPICCDKTYYTYINIHRLMFSSCFFSNFQTFCLNSAFFYQLLFSLKPTQESLRAGICPLVSVVTTAEASVSDTCQAGLESKLPS